MPPSELSEFDPNAQSELMRLAAKRAAERDYSERYSAQKRAALSQIANRGAGVATPYDSYQAADIAAVNTGEYPVVPASGTSA